MKHMMKFLVLFALLTVGVFAQEFPGPFVVNGVPVSNLVIVVGDTAPASDVVAAVKIARAFYPETSQTDPAPLPERLTRLASEIDDISNYNSIVIGNGCYSAVANALLNYPEQCSVGGIKLIKHPNGNVALLIMGVTEDEVRQNTELWLSGGLVPGETSQPASSFVLKIDATYIVVANRVEYQMQLIDMSGDVGKFDVNGEIFKLSPGERYKLANGAVFVLNKFSAGHFAEIYMEGFTSGYLYTGQVCTDSDNGRTPWQIGKTCIGGDCKVDFCEGNTLHEYYCSNDQIVVSPGECQGVCRDGACLTETFPQPAVDTVPSDYNACVAKLARYKKQLLESYPEGEIPEEKMQNYQEMHNRCQRLAPPVEAERFKLPPGETICPPGSEQVVPGVCARLEPSVKVIEAKEPCIGCARNSHCLAYGIRLLEDDKPMYCDIDSLLKPQKQLSEACQNNYECLSNGCSQKCISVEERIEAVERELKEQRGLIEKILDFFKSLFGG